MPAIQQARVGCGESAKQFSYLKGNDTQVTVSSNDVTIAVTDFGVVTLSPDSLTKILIPWNRVINVKF